MQVPDGKSLIATVAFALAAAAGWAQEEGEEVRELAPGLYTTVDEAEIYLIRPDGEQVDVKTGESLLVTREGFEFMGRRPEILEWPCGTALAGGRGTLPTFTVDDLQPGNIITQVARRWFENTEVLMPRATWLNGDVHVRVPVGMIEEYVDQRAFWYRTGPATDKMAALRPKTLLISMYRGTGQVVVDTNHLEALKEEYRGGDIPVVFEYPDEIVVPVSYFGYRPPPSLIQQAFLERGVQAADVPMRYGGDYHLELETRQLADTLGAPELGEITPERRAVLERELRERGFKGKPVVLFIMADSDVIVADEAEKVRVAEAMGFETVPVLFDFFTDITPAIRCGVAPPVAAVGALGLADPGGEIPPDPIGTSPSDKQVEPPPEIVLPDPPQPELPVSGN